MKRGGSLNQLLNAAAGNHGYALADKTSAWEARVLKRIATTLAKRRTRVAKKAKPRPKAASRSNEPSQLDRIESLLLALVAEWHGKEVK